MNIKPITLRFFDTSVTDKCADLATKLGVKFTVVKEDNLPDEFITEPINSTKRREFISKWANLTMKRE